MRSPTHRRPTRSRNLDPLNAARDRELLVITVEPLGELNRSAEDELAAEAERLVPFRGAETAELRVATL